MVLNLEVVLQSSPSLCMIQQMTVGIENTERENKFKPFSLLVFKYYKNSYCLLRNFLSIKWNLM